MKKILLLSVATCLVSSVWADQKSEAILGALAQKVAGWGDYRVDFSVVAESHSVADGGRSAAGGGSQADVGHSIAGHYVVSGNRYRITTPEVVIFSDRRTRYEAHLPEREIVIDTIDPLDRTVLGNPARLFDFLDGGYTHRYIGPAIVGGVQCERIEVTEKPKTASKNGGKSGQSKSAKSAKTTLEGPVVEVFVSVATGLPVRLSYRLATMKGSTAIDVAKITPHIAARDADFSFDPARWAGYEVIDFR